MKANTATEQGASAEYQRAIFGTWVQDGQKSRFAPGPPPQSQVRTYEPAGAGYTLTFEAITSEGTPDSWSYTAEYDGKDYPVTGSPAVDSIALTQVDPVTTLGIFKKAGFEVGMYRRTISKDRTTLTITTAGISARGEPYYDVTVFHKQ